MSKPIIGPLISKPFAASESALYLQRRIQALEAEIKELRADCPAAVSSQNADSPILRVGQTVPFGRNGTMWRILKRVNGRVLLLCCEPVAMFSRSELQNVRQWLHETYHENCFTDDQQFWIYYVPGSGKLFLLSGGEVQSWLPAQSDRVLKTPQGEKVSWWLESRRRKQEIVTTDGTLETVKDERRCAIRPAMWVDVIAFQQETAAD